MTISAQISITDLNSGHIVPHLPIYSARFVLTAAPISKLFLPNFAGSMLRGAYGHALRKLVCMTKAPSCEGCNLRFSCPFPRLFEPYGIDITKVGLRHNQATPPPPFIIVPPQIGHYAIEADQSFQFEIRLFGSSIHELSLIIEAWRRALLKGLGTSKVSCHLLTVECQLPDHDLLIYDGSNNLLTQVPIEYLSSEIEKTRPEKDCTLVVSSPLRLQTNGKRFAIKDLSVERLVMDSVRRTRLLVAVCGTESDKKQVAVWPLNDWKQSALKANLTSDLNWMEWSRQSSRQGQTINTGGWMGSIEIKNADPAVYYALKMAEITGLGKECVFGFGRVNIVPAPF